MFSLPIFNTLVWGWHFVPGNPLSGPPDYTFMGNISTGRRSDKFEANGSLGLLLGGDQWLLAPRGTPLIPSCTNQQPDMIQIDPTNRAVFYLVTKVAYAGFNFQNEHLAAWLYFYDAIAAGAIAGPGGAWAPFAQAYPLL